LESDFGLEYSLLLEIMSEKRQEIIENIEDDKLRKIVFSEIASDLFMSKIRNIIAGHNPEILANSNYQFDSTEYLAVKKDIKEAVSQLIEKKKSKKGKV
jgi:precorrin-2 dehydrogenase/sirohydrochlorin ferrochelatase